jgi:phage/plasmid-associated DNA primase
LTDARYAQRFAEVFGRELKFDKRARCWRRWDGTRWNQGNEAAVSAAVQFAKLRQADALQIVDGPIREQVVIHAIRAESRAAIENVLAVARHLPPMFDDGEQWNNEPWLLGCPTGVLDLRAGVMRDGMPADRITMSTMVDVYAVGRSARVGSIR